MTLSEVPIGTRAKFIGKTGRHSIRQTRAGNAFVKADLDIGNGQSVRCVWWSASAVPAAGTEVEVAGVVRHYRGVAQLHVDQTRIMRSPADLTIEHRLLRFYISCLESEQMRELQFLASDAGRRFIAIEEGEELIVTGESPVVALPPNGKRDQWLSRQILSGSSDQVFAGYPVVCANQREGNANRRLISPLFFLQVEPRRETDGSFALAPVQSLPDLNEYALQLLGLSAEERRGLVETIEENEQIESADSPYARITAWIDMLKIEGLISESAALNRTKLAPLRDGPSNTAILFVGERGPVIRNLARDLEDLESESADQLRKGPLGTLFGFARGAAPAVGIDAYPAVVPSNLAQDRAIAATMREPLTVLTGPPGTGKSQVLVNTIAAAVVRGERVLFASKNNQAVDVVFERLAAVSSEGAPLRAGNLSLRSQLAAQIKKALAKPVMPTEIGSAWEKWRIVESELRAIYAKALEREAAEAQLSSAETAYWEAQQRVDRRVFQLQHALQVATMAGESLRAIEVANRPRPFLPWRRRRWHNDQEAAETRWRQLRAAISPVATLSQSPDRNEAQWCLSLSKAAIAVEDHRRLVESARTRLDSLPDYLTTNDELKAAEDHRLESSIGLLRQTWRSLGSAAGPNVRSAATEFAEAATQSSGGSRATAKLTSLVPDLLPLFPVWGLTSFSARTNLPLTPGLFDLVIIDEASQCDIASALPLLFRAKRALVIGDPKQLIHVTSLTEPAEHRIADSCGLDQRTAAFYSYRSRSLFGLASSRVSDRPLFLDQHFRSHPAIITFSNDHFYGGRLLIMTEASAGKNGQPVEWRNTQGVFERGPRGRSVVNRAEAQVAIEAVAELGRSQPDAEVSIGIVTPFRAQADLIQDLVTRQLPDFRDSLVIATAHRFQGDERDVMIFSPTVCSSMPASLVRFASNPNLLNVAITRAREKLIIVGDLTACRGSRGALAYLASYVWDLENSPFRSPLERRLYDALYAAGIPVQAGVEAGGYILDIAIVSGHRRIDIECDGARWHRDHRADSIRDERLRQAGWHIVRFSGIEIQRNLDGCVERVRELLA